jgi:hypothetical protein
MNLDEEDLEEFMNTFKLSFLMITAVSYSYLSFAQSPSNQMPINTNTSSLELDKFDEPTPNYSVAQIVPAYKIALKKGMFEVSGGYGHMDETQQSSFGQAQNIKLNPQTDFFPVQLAYAFTDNFNIGIMARTLRTTDRITNSSFEGYSEPQLTASYAFRNAYSALLLTGIYTADVGPKEMTDKGISRKEGNALKGGSSGELLGGYFARLGPMILGGEISYLYKDSRIVNTKEIVPFTSVDTAPTQTRQEGGAEKSIRAVAELAMSFRLGIFAGRTWVEPEDRIIVNQFAPVTFNSYYKDFFGAYGRIQVHPRLSVIPLISVTEAPDTSGQSSHSNHEVLTQANLRFRF